MKLYWFNKLCCVPGCYNTSSEGEGCFKEYFDLPAEPQARRRWLNAILSEDGENLKICEDHFKDDDIFRDKNNRKKLRLNSVPSVKLPQHICPKCLGSKKQSDCSFNNYERKVCHCEPASIGLKSTQHVSPTTKRTRITWKVEEKKTLFRAIKKYGELRFGKNKIRINWNNVVNYCRSNGCFGNEKELKSVWHNIRANASRVYRNEIFGSKLERKVSRFLYGKIPKSSRSRPAAGERRSSNNSSNQSMTVESTDEDEYRERARAMMQDFQEEDMNNSAITEDIDAKDKQVEEVEKSEAAEEDDESDEYYSISDIEEIFQIKIRPRPPESSTKVISLLSSDDEDP